MLAKIFSCAILGLESQLVEVEVDISSGFPCFNIVGLPDKAVEEAKERIKSAFKNSGLKFPNRQRVIINLAPADLKKEGPSYDLPMAIGILVASGKINIEKLNLNKSIFVGELALNGDLRYTKGILSIALFAQQRQMDSLYLPKPNLKEAELIKELKIYPLESFQQLVKHLNGEEKITPSLSQGVKIDQDEESFKIDMAFIKGQNQAKRALEIAASGGHNLLMTGPPGTGKTLLARAVPSILPPMTEKEILEVTKIYSVAGLLSEKNPLVSQRPFRSPHHTSSGIALVGGGQIPRPGEVTLAHRGVLFLDELPQFPRNNLENLRQPLEDGVITISRAQMSYTFPAKFILIAAQNPCPCGYYGDPEIKCTCSPSQILRYRQKISGPILDRIDLHVDVPRLNFKELSQEKINESSKQIRERVKRAREIQKERFKDRNILTNAEMGIKEIKEFCPINSQAQQLLRQAIEQMHLSARAYHRLLKVSRTIADLEGEKEIKTEHLAEALQYRQKLEEENF